MSDQPTTKQMGDACEMLVAAELTLAGTPALKVPDNWPGYDIIAQPTDCGPQRISVKARRFKKGSSYINYNKNDSFEWLALVIIHKDSRNIYIIPRDIADLKARKNKPGTKTEDERYYSISEIETVFKEFKNNFSLKRTYP